jgi:hypothetical protein
MSTNDSHANCHGPIENEPSHAKNTGFYQQTSASDGKNNTT